MQLREFLFETTLLLLSGKLVHRNYRKKRIKKMTEKKDIAQLKELVTLIVKGAGLGVEIAKDGKFGFDDVASLVRLVPTVTAAVEGIGQVPAELSDLSAEEVAELASLVAAELAVDSEKAKAIIAASFKVLASLVALLTAVKA